MDVEQNRKLDELVEEYWDAICTAFTGERLTELLDALALRAYQIGYQTRVDEE